MGKVSLIKEKIIKKIRVIIKAVILKKREKNNQQSHNILYPK